MIIQTLASRSSAPATDASALEASISALKSSISALESSINSLDGASGFWEKVGWYCAIAVGVGVIAEVFTIVREYLEDRHSWRRGIMRPPDCPSFGWVWFDVFATVVVVAGIFGEAGATGKISSINSLLRSRTSELRAKSDQLLGLITREAGIATKQAGDANERAGKNEKSAADANRKAEAEKLARAELEASVAWRRLSDRQKIDMSSELRKRNLAPEQIRVVFLPSDVEASNFAADIVEMLRDAGFPVFPPEPIGFSNPDPVRITDPVQRATTGVQILGTDDDPSREIKKGIKETLEAHGFDVKIGTSNAAGVAQVLGPNVALGVGPRPLGPQGEYKLKAGKHVQVKKPDATKK